MVCRPTHNCCVFLPIETGVWALCLVTLVVTVGIISLTSSEAPIRISTMIISPQLQVGLAAWSFFGIIVSVAAAVGVRDRSPRNVKVFFWYHLFSFFIGVSIPLYFTASGTVCNEGYVGAGAHNMGSSFECSFLDSITMVWTLIYCVCHMYTVYVIWSLAEVFINATDAELISHSTALLKARKLKANAAPRQQRLPQQQPMPQPQPQPPQPQPQQYAAFAPAPPPMPTKTIAGAPVTTVMAPNPYATQLAPPPTSFRGFAPAPTAQAVYGNAPASYAPASYAPANYGSMAQPTSGTPQSFFPAPGSGFVSQER